MKSLIPEDRLGDLIRSSISLMCKTSLDYSSEIQVKGLLGVTLDKKKVLLIDVAEIISSEGNHLAENAPESDSDDGGSYKKSLKRPAAKRLSSNKAGSKKKRTTLKGTRFQQNDSSEVLLDMEAHGTQGESHEDNLEEGKSTISDPQYKVIKVEKTDTHNDRNDEDGNDDGGPDFDDDDDDEEEVEYSDDGETDPDYKVPIKSKNIPSAAAGKSDETPTESPASSVKNERFQQTIATDVYSFQQDKQLSERTLRKCSWACRVYEEWRTWSKESKEGPLQYLPTPEEFLTISDEEICCVLQSFILETRKADGSKYGPTSLNGMIKSFVKYISLKGKIINIFGDSRYASVKETLAYAMSECAKEVSDTPKKSKAISKSDEDYLWDNGYLGHETPQQLLNAFFWLISSNFNIKGRDEHRALTIKNFELGYAIDGVRYLKYIPSPGSKQQEIETVMENSDPVKCVVKTFEKYTNQVEAENLEEALYWSPYKSELEEFWFGRRVIGSHVIANMIKTIMHSAGFTGQYTNMSPRESSNNRR